MLVAELKGKKVPENLIKIEEEESNEIEAGNHEAKFTRRNNLRS